MFRFNSSGRDPLAADWVMLKTALAAMDAARSFTPVAW